MSLLRVSVLVLAAASWAPRHVTASPAFVVGDDGPLQEIFLDKRLFLHRRDAGHAGPNDFRTSDLLQEWLKSLTFRIPTTKVETGGFAITISNGICRRVELAGISSSQEPNGDFNLRATGLGLGCTLHWEVESLVLPIKSNGDVHAVVSESNIGSPISIVSDALTPPMPVSIRTYNCTGSIKVTDLQFSGGVISTFLEILSNFIKSFLSKQLVGIICTNVDELINTNGTIAVKHLNELARDFLKLPNDPLQPPVLPQPASHYADYTSNAGIRLLTDLVKKVIGNFDNALNINNLVNLGSGGRGEISLGNLTSNNLSHSITLAGLGTVKVTLEALSLGGLNTWSKLELSTPAPQQLSYGLALKKFLANTSLSIDVTVSDNSSSPLQGETLTEKFNLSVGLQSFGTSASGFLAIDKSQFQALTIDQYASVGCVEQAIYKCMETRASFDLGLVQPSVIPRNDETLERDVDRMLTLLMDALLGQYHGALEAVTRQLVSVVVRDYLNSQIDSALQRGQTCAAPQVSYIYPSAAAAFQTLAYTLLFLGTMTCVFFSLLGRCYKKSRARTVDLSHQQVTARPLPSADLNETDGTMPNGVVGETFQSSTSAGLANNSSAPLNVNMPASKCEGGLLTNSQALTSLPTTAGSTAAATEEIPGSNATDRTEPEYLARAGPSGFYSLEPEQSPRWDCLAFHPRISKSLSYGLPLLIVANITIFIAGNLGVGTSVFLSLTVNDQDVIDLPPVRDFGLINSVKDMWAGRVYPLAIAIAFFSGCWPYVKLIAMLVCWYTPSTRLSEDFRYATLRFLDMFGKWSLLDTYVLIIMMVAFRFQVSTSTANPLVKLPFDEVGAAAEMTFYVQPGTGFYLFLFGTIFSLLLGHIACGCHRYAKRLGEYAPYTISQAEMQATYTFNGEMGITCGDDGIVQEVVGGKPAHAKGIRAGHTIVNVSTNGDTQPPAPQREVSRAASDTLLRGGDSQPLAFSQERLRSAETSGSNYDVTVRMGEDTEYRLCDKNSTGSLYSYGPSVALFVSLLLVSWGVFEITFSFHFHGLAALMLGPDDSVRPQSAISLALAIPGSTQDPNNVGIRWIQSSFMLFTFIVTAAYHVILIALWSIKMSVKHQRHLFVAAQVMNAWSALDVFVVTILVSVLEISLFIKIQIVGPDCHGLNPIIAKLPFADKIPGSPTCYDVTSVLQKGFLILFFSVVISTVTGQIVLARVSNALRVTRNDGNTPRT